MRIPAWMLVHIAQYEPHEGNTAFEPVYGAPVALRCRIEPKRTLYRTREGDEVMASAVLFAAPDEPITEQGRVTWAGVTYTVLSVDRLPGPSGAIHHLECVLQ